MKCPHHETTYHLRCSLLAGHDGAHRYPRLRPHQREGEVKRLDLLCERVESLDAEVRRRLGARDGAHLNPHITLLELARRIEELETRIGVLENEKADGE